METIVRFECGDKRDCRRSSELWSHYTPAGQDVQDLYYKLAGPEEELKDYKGVVELLDSYFVPKVNVTFERHVFKQMEQQSHETVDKCVCRLRQKVSTCEISNVDETIRDQLIREISRWQAETMLSGENKCSFKSHARYCKSS